MKRIYDGLMAAVVLLMFVPTTLILVSWNAIPGDGFYPLKSGLEDITLTLLAGTPLVPEISMKYTDRRIVEAAALLDKKGSTVGYDLLIAEATQTQNYISEKSDAKSAIEFSKNIDEYKQQIQETKTEIRKQENLPPPVPNALPTPKQMVTSLPENTSGVTGTQSIVVNVPETVVIQQEDSEEVINKLEEVEEKLEEIQEAVNKNANNKNNNEKNQNTQDKPNDK